MYKICSLCNENKPLMLFAKDKKIKSGYRNKCKSCYNQRHYAQIVKRGGSPQLKTRYGITLDDYNVMLKEQNNCCAICNKHENTFKKKLSVDHNHTTKEVRKLLCDGCNTAFGLLYEDEEIINSMLTYLRKFKNGT